MCDKEIELKNYVDIPKRKKIITKYKKRDKLEEYDPSYNDGRPILFMGHEIYCDDSSAAFTDMYSIIFNRKDDFIKNKNFPCYWNNIINEIQAEEHTGIIKNSIINKTEIEKTKSIIKLFEEMIKDNDAE